MKKWFCTMALILTACAAPVTQPTPTLLSVPVFLPLPTATITLTPPPSITPLPTQTLALYEQYSIDYLRRRSYTGGSLDMVEVLAEHRNFTTWLVRYLSDGLYIYAVMNVPKGEGVYPVIISVHGYTNPANYNVLATDFTIENELAGRGYITIHPTLRNYAPSDPGDNLFRVGDTIDVLNLIEVIKLQSGTGILEKADAGRIGLGGRSMGGGVVLRALTVSQDVRAAYLYSPISGDERLNVDFFHEFARGDTQFTGEKDAAGDVIDAASPQNHYSSITASVLLAHGINDRVIPGTWSEDTCNRLKAAGVEKRCIFYRGADHTFHDDDLDDFILEVITFLGKHL